MPRQSLPTRRPSVRPGLVRVARAGHLDAARDDAELGIVQRAKVIDPRIQLQLGDTGREQRPVLLRNVPVGRRGRSRSSRTVSRTCSSMQLGWSTYIFTRLMILPPLLGGHMSPDASGAPGWRGHSAAHAAAQDPARRARRRHLRPVSPPGEGKTYASRQGFFFGLCPQEVIAKKRPQHGAAPPATKGDRRRAAVASRARPPGQMAGAPLGEQVQPTSHPLHHERIWRVSAPGRPCALPHGARVVGALVLPCRFYYTL